MRKPKGSQGCQDVTVWESLDDLTLREEEVGAWKTYIHVDNMERKGGVFLWWILIGTQAFFFASKEKTGERYMMFTKKWQDCGE